MGKRAYRIIGMDCSDEVALLKRSVGAVVGDEKALSFDLVKSKMTVDLDGDRVEEGQILSAVAKTGMQAVPWAEPCGRGVCGIEGGRWRAHGRWIMCLVSGVLMVAGFAVDMLHRGDLLATVLHHEQAETPVNAAAAMFYLGAITAGGWFILPKAISALRYLKPDMNLLMAVAVTGALILGQWLEAASVTFLFSVALMLESWSVERARRAIRTLMDLSPVSARFICPVDGNIEEKHVDQVPVGTTVLVRPGEKIPLDGVVTRGATTVNQAPITGESMPVSKGCGDEVYAGTINGEGTFEFRSTKPSSDTTLSRIIHMVEEAQERRAPVEQWVTQFSRYYTPAMMILAVLIGTLPPVLLGAPWKEWVYQALVLLVIACPCSLVISTPVSIVAALTSAARQGILIKGGAFLEAPAHLKVMAFDKTGTLTVGRPAVQTVIPLNHHTESEILALAAALETHSTHPFARAVVNLVHERAIEYSPADELTALSGQGAQGRIGGKPYWIGSHRMLEQLQPETSTVHRAAEALEDAGHSVVILWCEDHICGLMSLADGLRPEARDSLDALRALGLERIVMLTGDNLGTAARVAAETGVDEFHAELLPADKVKIVQELRRTHGKVAMVGDGVNDAPAMASADVSIAMGAMGSDAAIETADIALMSDDLSRLPWLVRHARTTLAVIQQNIIFSLVIKSLFLVLALMGLGTLWAAIAADMGASLLVIFNGMRLLTRREEAPPSAPMLEEGSVSSGRDHCPTVGSSCS